MNYGSILLNIIIHLFKWRQYQQNPKRAKGLAVGETLVLDPHLLQKSTITRLALLILYSIQVCGLYDLKIKYTYIFITNTNGCV